MYGFNSTRKSRENNLQVSTNHSHGRSITILPLKASCSIRHHFISGYKPLNRHSNRKRYLNKSSRRLSWFRVILPHTDRFNNIPVYRFVNEAVPTHHVYMDASNDDCLCAIEPSLWQYLRVQFTEKVTAFDKHTRT
ncbi:hypothetical protein PHMEG_0008353 [Phytophthora megakarya]|uniref:Uncharacterized protein n=1 Tax=Phytophthora megakarya TaxID=4795 RepID=A0A225WJ08_9STRA|nr:hypothetical protein PHMEG_0008353 [Phytophthora megakarya]